MVQYGVEREKILVKDKTYMTELILKWNKTPPLKYFSYDRNQITHFNGSQCCHSLHKVDRVRDPVYDNRCKWPDNMASRLACSPWGNCNTLPLPHTSFCTLNTLNNFPHPPFALVCFPWSVKN
jgi:hypothetical protein